ncbi:hypothetical protein A2960_06190 [Candidatus Gottesmanbacteria bacterium RIFCSPLOWO2_01_FULL_39_12b]|uniref:Membrane insertase YidC/Oxa/ALB C-terminal domain-containing protein n=1 Tax=Candidatus Gottesmanbacteria bacterium RIFCSPLOWO2_01_FULL_39_12b TaxID=1798388 RepID=A0A1F6AP45_9BACT|nr:MAG: hypothetical protein A2960_06190 [Candidatus Gottesmanbacteria bacterium RIFCSPLOWO2_01_FULL_39_12b]
MFNTNNIFEVIFVIPILNVLIGFYKLFLVLRIPGALGFSLIILTGLIKLVLHPLTVTQLKSTYQLNKLKPEIEKITAKYKNDKLRQQQEQLKLYKQEGINPAAGCLPTLLQLPIMFALYNMFFNLVGQGVSDGVVEGINKVLYFPFLNISHLDLSFLGVNLAFKPSQWQTLGWWILLIPLVTGLLQYWQTKIMMPKAKIVPQPKASEPKDDDMATAMQKQMGIMMPLMIGYFSYSFSLGLSLYWNAFTIFGIIQQYQLNKVFYEKKDDQNNQTQKG